MTDLTIAALDIRRGGQPIVGGVDISVPAGSVTALLGPNGAGKSTLVLGLTGLLPVDGGSVRLGETELVGLRPEQIRTRGLAAVPEGHRVLTQLSVRDNVIAALGSSPKMAANEAVELAYRVFPELEPLSDRLAGRLSGGQQQMLAFAQALVVEPTTLVIDEMSLGLAPVIVRRLTTVVAETAARGIGILLIEQYANVALSLATDAYVMHKGAISFTGPARALVDDPGLLHAAYFGDTAT